MYEVVIPFDIMDLPSGAAYNSVNGLIRSLKDGGSGGYSINNDVNILTAIPLTVDRSTDEQTDEKGALIFAAAYSILTATISGEKADTESFKRLYQTVDAQLTPDNEITWHFTRFKNEPVLPGMTRS
jgi:hypothetical protein